MLQRSLQSSLLWWVVWMPPSIWMENDGISNLGNGLWNSPLYARRTFQSLMSIQSRVFRPWTVENSKGPRIYVDSWVIVTHRRKGSSPFLAAYIALVLDGRMRWVIELRVGVNTDHPVYDAVASSAGLFHCIWCLMCVGCKTRREFCRPACTMDGGT